MSSNGVNNKAETVVETVKLLPILIIPGFMSSGLEIQESALRKDWQGQRLWINLSSLGFQSINFNPSASKSVEKEPDAKHTEYKSDWLKHMSLQSDLETEREGVVVRPIPGLAGVDYLTPGALTNHVSYVFGPVIKALVDAGYTEGLNLDAMSYDWRLSPAAVEKRDQYFSRTIQRVEQMYNENNDTPVVIMGHSLGVKVSHYFLNFAKDRKGQAWLDKYIHTWMPVGGPHLGASKAVRSTICGDKMGLDTFLNDEEALAFGRSLGSGPWLIPGRLPPGVPSTFYFHSQGVLEVRVTSPICVEAMLQDRADISKSKKFKLSLVYNGHVATTDYRVPKDGILEFDEVFTFATGPEGPGSAKGSNDLLQVLLLEPGVSATKYKKDTRGSCGKLSSVFWHLVLFPFCFIKYFTVLSAEAVSRVVGSGAILAASMPVKVSETLEDLSGETSVDVELYYGDDGEKMYRLGGCLQRCAKEPTLELVSLMMAYTPPTMPRPSKRKSALVMMDKSTSAPELASDRLNISCADLMEREGLDDIIGLIENVYDTDPVGPRTRSAMDAPPVKRIKAIYGKNLTTEVGAFYRRRPASIEKNTTNRFELDHGAKLSKSSTNHGYMLKGGVLYETEKRNLADNAECSGDGTVPYYSLAYVKTWESECEVEVSELEKAEHRAILADPRFHECVLDYCSFGKISTTASQRKNKKSFGRKSHQ